MPKFVGWEASGDIVTLKKNQFGLEEEVIKKHFPKKSGLVLNDGNRLGKVLKQYPELCDATRIQYEFYTL